MIRSPLVRADGAPDQSRTGQEQQTEHDIAKVAIAERLIEPRTEPAPENGSREGEQREIDYLPSDQSACCLQAQS